MQFCTGEVNFQWEGPIFRGQLIENPLTDKTYVDAVTLWHIPANASDFTSCHDDI
jgi:hypothetical protein